MERTIGRLFPKPDTAPFKQEETVEVKKETKKKTTKKNKEEKED